MGWERSQAVIMEGDIMKEIKTPTSGIKCDKCGKVIPVTNPDINYPTDYVWRDGKNLCNECNKCVYK